MARKVGVEIVGDALSYTSALGTASAETVKFGTTYKTAFAGMSDSTLRLAVAQDKLAISTARYSVGSTGAAAATLRYRMEVDALSASQLRAAAAVGTALSKYVTVPVAALGFEAAKAATNFQSSMLLIQTQAGASAEEVQKLTGQVLNLASSGAQQGPNTLAQGLFHLESLGLRGSDAMNALKVSSDAAAVGMANLEDVTTALGGVVVTGIKGSQNFQEAMGTLNATIGAGNMHMEDLVAALGTGVVPAAKNAGITLSELGAALAVMTDRGIDAAAAGTRLRMTFALMQDPSNKAIKALHAMGINANDMATTLRGPNGLLTVLQMLQAGMDRVGKTQGSKDILAAFGGGRSGSAILTLIQSLTSGVSSYQGKVAQIQQTSGNLLQSEKVQQASAAAQFHKDLASMEADLTRLGDKMLPTVTFIVNGVNKIGDAFAKLPGPVKDELGIIAGALAVGGPLVLAGIGVTKVIKSIGDAFITVPVEAAPAIAATEGELVALGTTATATAGEITAVRTELGLLSAIGPIGIVISASIVLTPELISFMNWAGHGLSKAFSQAGGGSAVVAGSDPASKQPIEWWATQAAQLSTTHKDPQYWLKHGAAAAALLAKNGITQPPGLPADPNYLPIGVTPPGAVSGSSFGNTRMAPVPTPGQLANLGLARTAGETDSSRIAALNARIGVDTKAIAFGEGRIKAGTASKDLVKSTEAAYQDRASMLSEIASIDQAAADKQKSASDAAKAALKKRADAAKAAAAAALKALEDSYSNDAQTIQNKLALAQLAETNAGTNVTRIMAAQAKERTEEKALIALYDSQWKNAALPAADRLTARGNEIAAKSALAGIQGPGSTFVLPMSLQVAGAKASTTTGTADDRRVAAASKAFAQTMIKSGHLQGQALIDAYNEIASANSTLVGFTIPMALQVAAAKAATTTGLADDDLVARASKAFAEKMIKSGKLQGQSLIDAYNTIAAANSTLGTGNGTFTVPLKLQLAVAKAGITADTSDDRKAAQQIKTLAEKLLHSHKLSLQGQIDAYNTIAQENQVLGTKLAVGAKTVSAHALTAGLNLSHSQRVAIEQRTSQALAHGGHAPTGIGVQGQMVVTGNTIHLHGINDPKQMADALQKVGKRTSVATVGRNAGRSRALP